MAIEVMVKIMEYDLPPREKYILLLYGNYANKEGKGVYPGQETMSEISGYHRSTIIKVTEILKQSSLLFPDGRSEYRTLQWAINLKWKGKRKDIVKQIKKFNEKRNVHTGEHVEIPQHADVDTSEHDNVDTPEHSDVDSYDHNPLVNTPVKPSVKTTSTPPNIFGLYEQEIGIITPSTADRLKMWEKDYPEGWIEDAIKIAVKHNARNMAYTEAILERWRTEGKDNGRGNSKDNKEDESTPEISEADRRAADELHRKDLV